MVTLAHLSVQDYWRVVDTECLISLGCYRDRIAAYATTTKSTASQVRSERGLVLNVVEAFEENHVKVERGCYVIGSESPYRSSHHGLIKGDWPSLMRLIFKGERLQ